MNTYSPIYKIILVGDSGVGKTCLLSMYVKGECSPTIPTIAVEFCTKEIELDNNYKIKVQLWDTAGQERFKSLAMTYYRKAYGILLLFDVTKRSSFISCKNYLEEVRINSDKNCVIYLIGNKIDLEKQRQISLEEAQIFAKKENIKYVETSAVKNVRVEEVFTSLLNDIYEVKKEENKNKLFLETGNNTIGLKKDEKLLKTNNDKFWCCQ
jgi:Ras-related protein Rab-11A